MSHANMEIIIPPMDLDKIEDFIAAGLEPYYEEADPEIRASGAFYDFYKIGGRWDGYKEERKLDSEQVKRFFERIRAEEITVSGVQFGKQEISPADQIPKVDAIWREMFPESGRDSCPFFQHGSHDQYQNNLGNGNVTKLGDSMDVEAQGVAFVERDYNNNPEVSFLVFDAIWTGANRIKTVWDGTVQDAVDLRLEHLQIYNEEYRAKHAPAPDWLSVTIDYHS